MAICEHFMKGPKGAADLVGKLVEAATKPVYPLKASPRSPPTARPFGATSNSARVVATTRKNQGD